MSVTCYLLYHHVPANLETPNYFLYYLVNDAASNAALAAELNPSLSFSPSPSLTPSLSIFLHQVHSHQPSLFHFKSDI